MIIGSMRVVAVPVGTEIKGDKPGEVAAVEEGNGVRIGQTLYVTEKHFDALSKTCRPSSRSSDRSHGQHRDIGPINHLPDAGTMVGTHRSAHASSARTTRAA